MAEVRKGKKEKDERDDKNYSFSHSYSQLQHICVGFRPDTITQIGTSRLLRAGLAEESSDAWTFTQVPQR